MLKLNVTMLHNRKHNSSTQSVHTDNFYIMHTNRPETSDIMDGPLLQSNTHTHTCSEPYRISMNINMTHASRT